MSVVSVCCTEPRAAEPDTAIVHTLMRGDTVRQALTIADNASSTIILLVYYYNRRAPKKTADEFLMHTTNMSHVNWLTSWVTFNTQSL